MDAGRHPLIDVVTNAEVVGCTGEPGDFKVRIRKNPRYVREDLCVACGLCVDACPMVGGNEFDAGLKARKAIYRPFPQSVPAAYVIEPEACLNLRGFLSEKQRRRLEKVQKVKQRKMEDYHPGFLVCGHCTKACEVDAITLSPYLGRDSLEPFVTRAETFGRGLFVLSKTSNAGSGDLQDLELKDGLVHEAATRRLSQLGERLRPLA